ncbi:MAG: PAS domain-containing protein [Deltaproteobacteria bacterium]|nr:PAS domain-containing protein [Nannocystaceae bacterium]
MRSAPEPSDSDVGIIERSEGPRRPGRPPRPQARLAHERRIAYFMLFRVGMLALFTVLAGLLTLTDEPGMIGLRGLPVWSTIVAGYAMTIAYARGLPRARELAGFAWTQTALDIGLSAVAVQFTGGIDSGLVSLYMISVLGAATMGGRRQTWAAAATCAALYLGMSALELTDTLQPSTLTGDGVRPPLRDSLQIVARTLAALLAVTLLSSYLAVQLQTSVSQVGNLRLLNENIVRSLSSGLITADRDNHMLYFNPAARGILGLRDEQIGQPLSQVLPALAGVEAAAPEGRIDLQHALPDGRQIHVGLSRMPLRDASGDAVGQVINFQDVTRLHELAERVRRGERLAALGGMAASVAHEIRNPLAAISGSAELLSSANLGDEDRRLLAIIRRESSRLSDLVRDLLAFTRPRVPEPMRLELDRSVRETTEAFAADPNNAALEVRCEADPGALVDVDPVQLGQVLWNLMRNAAEAMHGKGVLRVRVRSTEGVVQMQVIDRGDGIAPDRLETIFDPFFTTKEHGTGFGLAIVHRIVNDNGGTIRVDSELGSGSTFTVTLPRAHDPIAAESSGVLSLD